MLRPGKQEAATKVAEHYASSGSKASAATEREDVAKERVLTLVYMHLRGGYCQAIRPQELDAGPSQLSEQPTQLPSRSQYMASRLSSQR